MKMTKVESSLVKGVGYDGKDLYVELVNGKNYKYENVPYSEYEKFLKSDSLGWYFNVHIKDRYHCERIK